MAADFQPLIFLVEDEKSSHLLYEHWLNVWGYNLISAAASYEEAEIFLQNVIPDLVLVDIRLGSSRNGVGLALEVLEPRNIPYIYISGLSDDDPLLEQVESTGSFGFLTKPVNWFNLKMALAMAFNRIEAEKKLRNRERTLQLTSNATRELLALVDLGGSIQYSNDAFARRINTGGRTELAALGDERLSQFFNRAIRQVAINRTAVEKPLLLGDETYMFNFFPVFDVLEMVEQVSIHGVNISPYRALQNRIIEAVINERKIIERDLHDNLGQLLTGLSYLGSHIARSTGELQTRQAAAKMENLMNQAIGRVRNLSLILDPLKDFSGDLHQALHDFTASLRDIYGIGVSLQLADISIDDVDYNTSLFYIILESVNNALKHSTVKSLSIVLTARGERCSLSIFAVIEPGSMKKTIETGLGMETMRYRAGLVAGELVFRPGRAYSLVRVRFELP